jgi:cardiolipin synthase A/B
MTYAWQDGNRGELLINGEQYFRAAFAAIREARKEVLLETFIIFDDEVGNGLKAALLEAALRGARIEVTVDGYGSADLRGDYVAELAAAGIRVHAYDPRKRLLGMRTNLFRRLHRKLLVVDGEVAFIGGINFGADHLPDSYEMAKQDYAVRVVGPIVAHIHDACRRMLLEKHAAPDLPPAAPISRPAGSAAMLLAIRDNHRNRNDIEEQYLQALRQARRRVIVANAYFFPGYRILRALRDAACRGVEVTLILQGRPDMPWARMFSSLLYGDLLGDGIDVCEFTQRPLHAKVAVIDDEWATVGSSNLDPLSLSLNLEANLFIRP